MQSMKAVLIAVCGITVGGLLVVADGGAKASENGTIPAAAQATEARVTGEADTPSLAGLRISDTELSAASRLAADGWRKFGSDGTYIRGAEKIQAEFDASGLIELTKWSDVPGGYQAAKEACQSLVGDVFDDPAKLSVNCELGEVSAETGDAVTLGYTATAGSVGWRAVETLQIRHDVLLGSEQQ